MRDIPDLLKGLELSIKILSEFVESIPDDKIHVCRGEGFWTISEHVSHLAEVQPMLLNRVERFINEPHPEFIPYIPGSTEEEQSPPAPMPTASALDQFARYRMRQIQVLQSADPASWQKTATHPEYEIYSLYILTRHVLMHDHWHMYRMEELWLTKDDYLTRL